MQSRINSGQSRPGTANIASSNLSPTMQEIMKRQIFDIRERLLEY
jgi:hypothetical protein